MSASNWSLQIGPKARRAASKLRRADDRSVIESESDDGLLEVRCYSCRGTGVCDECEGNCCDCGGLRVEWTPR